MVCDAGGGTVELITFEVTREDPLRFKQLTLPDGKFIYKNLQITLLIYRSIVLRLSLFGQAYV